MDEQTEEVVGSIEPADVAPPVEQKAVKAAATADDDADDGQAKSPPDKSAEMAQQMHDLAVAMGATCGEKKSAGFTVPVAGIWAMTANGPVVKAFSLNERVDKVRRAWMRIYRQRSVVPGAESDMVAVEGDLPYIRDVLDDQLIVSNHGDLFSYSYTVKADGSIDFDQPVRVEVKYEPVNGPGLKSLAIKAISEDEKGIVVGGYLLLWGDASHKDMGGDYFVKGVTDLWLERYPNAPSLFHHGLDQKLGLSVIGHRVKAVLDDTGAWVESWLDKSSQYWSMVKPLLEKEALFYSPGSASHLVKRNPDGQLKSFPVIEDTLTPVPMQHRLLPVSQIKAAYQLVRSSYSAVKSDIDDELEVDEELLAELDELDDELPEEDFPEDDEGEESPEDDEGEWDWIEDEEEQIEEDDDSDEAAATLEALRREADILAAAITTADVAHRLKQVNS